MGMPDTLAEAPKVPTHVSYWDCGALKPMLGELASDKGKAS
jgi:hypothetical protein